MGWRHHPAFVGATEITDKADQIDAAIAAVGPGAESFIPRAFEHQLSAIFGGVPVAWPAYRSGEPFFATLALTIANAVQSEAALELYRQAEIRTVEWVTTGGADVCEKCRATDGVVVRSGDLFPHVGVASPPAHEGCHCALMAADEDVRYDPARDAAASPENP